MYPLQLSLPGLTSDATIMLGQSQETLIVQFIGLVANLPSTHSLTHSHVWACVCRSMQRCSMHRLV